MSYSLIGSLDQIPKSKFRTNLGSLVLFSSPTNVDIQSTPFEAHGVFVRLPNQCWDITIHPPSGASVLTRWHLFLSPIDVGPPPNPLPSGPSSLLGPWCFCSAPQPMLGHHNPPPFGGQRPHSLALVPFSNRCGIATKSTPFGAIVLTGTPPRVYLPSRNSEKAYLPSRNSEKAGTSFGVWL